MILPEIILILIGLAAIYVLGCVLAFGLTIRFLMTYTSEPIDQYSIAAVAILSLRSWRQVVVYMQSIDQIKNPKDL